MTDSAVFETIEPLEPRSRAAPSAASTQIRGSTLLLVGRTLSMAVNFVVQILIVRYLAKTDYGAFAYALSIVAFGQSLVTFGLDRAVTRFIPIYDEQRADDKLFGTLVMVTGTILSLGVALLLVVYGLQAWLGGALVSDPQAIALLLILIVLAPVQALDDLVTGLFAVFASPRAIFFRRYVLAPGLRLAVVVLLILGGSGASFLALGYLLAGVAGLAMYSVMLVRLLNDRGLLARLRPRQLRFPVREVFGFTIPLLSSDILYILMNTSDAVLLGYFRGAPEVGAFRVIQPAAGLNQLVFSSFTLLFTPLAARLFARHDREGINDLYWQTAIWMAVFSFPIFALTFSLAGPLTVALYEARYEESAVYLALLSFGYYFNTALGFNGLTLKVFGKLRFVLVINLLAAAVNVALNLVLIPRYGALGAAIGTCATLIAHNVLKQAGLRLGTGISLFEPRYLRVYLVIAGAVGGLLVVQVALRPAIAVNLVLVGIASLVVLAAGRAVLRIGDTFPELLRLPLARRLLGG